ncbi:cyclic nucleotide-binding protein [Desulfitobacterium hafniense DCB-2]|uniref:Cyclic nucleotide-binding domain-containing protein n=2 Tax=Desulfitobacterium hafniense TaxID=49338 RepID=Q8RPH0_DESHA|nr:Crp/Fnr family transcriptional regulator [Desulfitobacterium hafniense]AAL87782.1 unknown [Desulfitobacterium hafniense DCB-2]ACL18769.1 cyclic nucleotide-binding protein [Desulfitobacterium hafniense DCB-2]
MNDLLPFLAQVSLFKGIETEELPKMLNRLNARKVSYKKNDVILREGQSVHSVGIMLSGKVKVVKEDFKGNTNVMTFIEPGAMFAEAYACTQTANLPFTVLSVMETKILWIDYRKIISTCTSACESHEKLIENMMKALASKSILLNQKIEHISKRTTQEKLLTYLFDQSKKSGSNEFEIPFSRQELADYLCVDRSAMSNELCKLQREGVLNFHLNHFKLSKSSSEAQL